VRRGLAAVTLRVVAAAALLLIVSLVPCACSAPMGGSSASDASDAPVRRQRDDEAASTQPLMARQSTVRFRLVPLRSCSSNGFTLPIVSPDGSHAAVQSAGATRFQTLLAASSEDGVDAGRVTMHDLTTGTSAEVAGGEMLLGRTADARGCLVESPRPDGSRWIGIAPWDGSEPQWLVQGEQVNALASIGPEDRLAWCRRNRESQRFDLVVRHHNGEQVIPAPEDGSWLAPQFTTDGRFIVVLRLRDGTLSACSFAMGNRAAEQPERVLDLSWRATLSMAYQTVVPQRNQQLGGATWAFFHPRFRRVGLWDVRTDQSRLLGNGSLSLVQMDAERALVATSEGLDIASLSTGDARTTDGSRLLDGVWVPLLRLADDRAVIARVRGPQIDILRIDLLPPE